MDLGTLLNRKMITRFLIASLILVVHHQQVSSDLIEITRNELDSKGGFLGASFAKSIAEIFYDKAESAEATENYPLLALLTEMARMHVSQHRREHDALSVASEIVNRYFVRSNLDTYDSLPKTKSFADLIVRRAIQNACEIEFEAEQNRRKRIYSLFKAHEEVPGVVQLAREYSLRIQDKKSRAIKSKENTDQALRKYQSDISDDVSGISASQTMRSVDELIALTRLARPRAHSGRQADIDRSPIMSDLNKMERKLIGKVNRLSNFAVERIPIEQVVAYEQAQVRSQFESMLLWIDIKRSELNEILREKIDEILFRPRQVLGKSAKNYYPMLALSAELAEAEALLYIFQIRMLRIVDNTIRRYLIDRTSSFNETLLENRYLLNTIMLRAEACSLEAGVMRLENQRKKLFLFVRAYDYDRDMTGLARKFYVDLNQQFARLAQINIESGASLKRYKYDVSFVMNESQLLDTDIQIDNLLREAIQRDYAAMVRNSSRSIVELDYLLEQFVGTDVVQAIRSTEQEVAGKVEHIDPRRIQSVEPQLVFEYEREILNL